MRLTERDVHFRARYWCGLIAGLGNKEAVAGAKGFVVSALRAAYPVGKGKGAYESLVWFGIGVGVVALRNVTSPAGRNF